MRYYTAELEVAAFNPAADDGVLVVKAPTDMAIMIVSAELSLGFASHELIHAAFGKATSDPTSATSVTPVAHMTGGNASGVTMYGADASGMTAEPTWAEPVNASYQGGYQWVYEPPYDARLILSPSERAGIRLLKALSGATDMQALITFAEIGG